MEDSIMKKRVEANMNQSNTAMFQSEMQKQRELDRQEIEKYGVRFFVKMRLENVDLGRIHQPPEERAVPSLR